MLCQLMCSTWIRCVHLAHERLRASGVFPEGGLSLMFALR